MRLDLSLSAQRRKTIGSLWSAFRGTFGTDLLLFAYETPGGLVSLTGPTLTYSPGSSGTYQNGVLQGRSCLRDADPLGKQKSIRGTCSAPIKSLWRVTKQTSVAAGSALNCIATNTVNSGLVKVGYNASAWFNNGWTIYENGVQTSTITYGAANIYEADLSSSTAVGVSVGGYYDDYVPRDAWADDALLAIALGVVPNVTQRVFLNRQMSSYLR